MKVKDLLFELENCDPEAEVRLATQPNYPLQYVLEDTVVESEDGAVYLAEGGQMWEPYLPSDVSQALGWR